MSIIQDILIGILVPIPIYIVLASHSLRHIVSQSNVSERAVESFLNNIGFPLRPFFTEQTGYNLFTNDQKVSVAHSLLTTPPSIPSVRMRIGWAAVSVILIISFAVGMTKQTDSVHIIQYALMLIANIIFLFWGWKFGSKLAQSEAEYRQ